MLAGKLGRGEGNWRDADVGGREGEENWGIDKSVYYVCYEEESRVPLGRILGCTAALVVALSCHFDVWRCRIGFRLEIVRFRDSGRLCRCYCFATKVPARRAIVAINEVIPNTKLSRQGLSKLVSLRVA